MTLDKTIISLYKSAFILAISLATAGCGGGGAGDTPSIDGPMLPIEEISGAVFAGQNLADFESQVVPDVRAAAPTGNATFEGTLTVIYGADIDGMAGNQDVAVGEALIQLNFAAGTLAGSATNFGLFSTSAGCIEIPACGLTPSSSMTGTINVADGIFAGSGFVAGLSGTLAGNGGFTVPDDALIGGGFGKLSGNNRLLLWGQSDMSLNTGGATDEPARLILGAQQTN